VTQGSAAEVLPQDVGGDDPWLFRPYSGSDDDEGGMMYLLGVSYTRSKAGWRAGADGAGRTHGIGRDGKREPLTQEQRTLATAKQQAFIAAHTPIWRWLLENADVTMAVDREKPDTDIWGWMVTSGDDVLHAIGCKRSVIKAGLGVELIRALAGDRWTRHQVLTLELPNLRATQHTKVKSSDIVDLTRPYTWSLDPTWLVTRMVGR
jgi:hypothetical protein